LPIEVDPEAPAGPAAAASPPPPPFAVTFPAIVTTGASSKTAPPLPPPPPTTPSLGPPMPLETMAPCAPTVIETPEVIWIALPGSPVPLELPPMAPAKSGTSSAEP
jgi:hypothetical protein